MNNETTPLPLDCMRPHHNRTFLTHLRKRSRYRSRIIRLRNFRAITVYCICKGKATTKPPKTNKTRTNQVHSICGCTSAFNHRINHFRLGRFTKSASHKRLEYRLVWDSPLCNMLSRYRRHSPNSRQLIILKEQPQKHSKGIPFPKNYQKKLLSQIPRQSQKTTLTQHEATSLSLSKAGAFRLIQVALHAI